MRILIAIALLSTLISAQPFFSIGIDEGPDDDFSAVLTKAIDAGMNSVQLVLNWSDMEPDSGQFNIAGSYITWAPGYYAGYGLKVMLYLNPIHMADKTVPLDLQDKDWDDPEMISRYKALLDSVAGYIGDETIYLVVGNEVDMYVLRDSADYATYKVFFDSAKAHFRSLHPDIPVGMVMQGTVLFEPAKGPFCLDLQESADLLMVTYYGNGLDDPAYIDPDTLGNVFNAIVAKSNGKPVAITELGYPSDPLVNSSLSQQADFFSNAFAAWEQHRDTISFVLCFKMWEWSRDHVLGSGWFDSTWYTDELLAYLTSIGLHDSLGNPKPAWDTLLAGAEAFGLIDAVEKGPALSDAGPTIVAWPNPFNAAVCVSLSDGVRAAFIESSAPARRMPPLQVSIYQTNGRRIADIPVTGNRATWNASRHPAGIYIVKIGMNNKTFTRKIILTR